MLEGGSAQSIWEQPLPLLPAKLGSLRCCANGIRQLACRNLAMQDPASWLNLIGLHLHPNWLCGCQTGHSARPPNRMDLLRHTVNCKLRSGAQWTQFATRKPLKSQLKCLDELIVPPFPQHLRHQEQVIVLSSTRICEQFHPRSPTSSQPRPQALRRW